MSARMNVNIQVFVCVYTSGSLGVPLFLKHGDILVISGLVLILCY